MNPATENRRILVTGIMFFYPLAGVGFQFLHYLIGLQELGYDVYYVEDSQRRLFDPKINDLTYDATNNVALVKPMLDRFGFGERWALRVRGDHAWHTHGPWGERIDELYATADAILNVTGGQEMTDELLGIPCRLYVESDPFASQVRYAQHDPHWRTLLDAHTHHFTFGENIGQPDCLIPETGLQWHPTRQPISLACWEPLQPEADAPFTTITTWSNNNNDVVYEGQTYRWTKNLAWEEFMSLPLQCNMPFEMAVRASEETVSRLRASGWVTRDAGDVSSNFDRYRDYIRRSYGEFTVARDQYVRARTGWSSDRSLCYLAAGRPVVTQETGACISLPHGEGLFSYSTMADAISAIETIRSDYPRHCRRAREIAEAFLDARIVVGQMMIQVGLS